MAPTLTGAPQLLGLLPHALEAQNNARQLYVNPRWSQRGQRGWRGAWALSGVLWSIPPHWGHRKGRQAPRTDGCALETALSDPSGPCGLSGPPHVATRPERPTVAPGGLPPRGGPEGQRAAVSCTSRQGCVPRLQRRTVSQNPKTKSGVLRASGPVSLQDPAPHTPGKVGTSTIALPPPRHPQGSPEATTGRGPRFCPSPNRIHMEI